MIVIIIAPNKISSHDYQQHILNAGTEPEQEHWRLFCYSGKFFFIQEKNRFFKERLFSYKQMKTFAVQAGSHLALQKLPLSGAPRWWW